MSLRDDFDALGQEARQRRNLKAWAARRAQGQATRGRILAYVAAHPDAGKIDVAVACGVSERTVWRVLAASRAQGANGGVGAARGTQEAS